MKKVNRIQRYFYLEITIFLFNFASALSATVYTNQLLYISCTTIFEYGETTCQLGLIKPTPASQYSKQLADEKTYGAISVNRTSKELEVNEIEVYSEDANDYAAATQNEESQPNNLNITTELEVETTPVPPKRYFYLEIPIFLFNFASALSATVYTNQLLYISCTTIFEYGETTCQPMLGLIKPIPASQLIEDRVQKFVSHIVLANSLITAIIPAILSLFLGPWSDKFGRRPILIATSAAAFVSYIIITILAVISEKQDMNPWVYILFSIPLTICGGSCSMMVIVYCFISDVAPAEVRAIRMFFNDASVGIGSALGSLTSSYLFAATNVAAVFGISAAISFLAFLYIIVFVKESLKPELMATGSKVRGFFNYKLVIQLFRTCFEKRSKFDRSILWLTIISLVVINYITTGENNVFYLFLVKKFGINLQTYTTYDAISNAIQIIGGIIALNILGKLLKVSLVTITAISLLCSVFESIVRAAAQAFWEMYLGAVIGFMSGITSALLLALIAFVVPPNEAGKVYALSNCLQTLTPLGSAPMYTAIYDGTLTSYPGLFNIISAVLYLVCFILTATIFGIQRRMGHRIGRSA